MRRRYALVEWLGKDQKNTYTWNVPIEWIIGFNHDEWKEDKRKGAADTNSYVIEWHDSETAQALGWPVYDGKIHEVSSQSKYLKAALKKLEKNVRRSLTLVLENHDLENPSSSNQRRSHHRSHHKSHASRHHSKTRSRSPIYSISASVSAPASQFRNSGESLPTSEPSNLGETSHTCSEGNMQRTPNTNDENFDKMNKRIDSLCRRMNYLENGCDKNRSTSVTDLSADRFQCIYARTLNPEMIDIGKKGSNITVDKFLWNGIIQQDTFTKMAVSLMLAVFEIDDLLKCNYKGGTSKINRRADRLQPLDRDKLDAIKQLVRYRFKDSYDETKFGRAINTKLTKLRIENGCS